MSEAIVGKPIDRVDGRLKVRGKAQYSAEYKRENMVYAMIVPSTISVGKIASIDTQAAEKLPGVLAIITHKNSAKLKTPKTDHKRGNVPGDEFAPLQNADIHFDGQPVALVIAETFEQATRAVERVEVKYDVSPGEYDIEATKKEPKKPATMFGKPIQKKKGDAEAALKECEVVIEQTYITPVQNHCAMEPSATIAEMEGDLITVYDATQGVVGVTRVIGEIFVCDPKKVRVVCHFLGGGFGSKGFTWPHTVLAVLGAQAVKRPVQLVLKRQLNFTNIGHREKTVQTIALGADKGGKIHAIRHVTTTATSKLTEFIEPCGNITNMLYASMNIEIQHKLHTLDIGSPTPMRAPGECPGSYGIECAMDELSYKLGIDPLELRVINYAEKDPETDLPWSSKQLRRCYEMGAEKFGWKNRKKEVNATVNGHEKVGWGMATCSYPAHKAKSSANAKMYPDGSVVIQCATQDIGTGTYTIMTQLAADVLGMPVNLIRFELGESNFPNGPVSGGSQTAASVGPAVMDVAMMLRKKLVEMAINSPASSLHGKSEGDMEYENGRVVLKNNKTTGESFKDIVQRSGEQAIEVKTGDEKTERVEDPKTHSLHSFGAVFVEVRVDEFLGRARVTRVVGTYDVGRILNEKTARNQAMGGIIFGIGMALMEETMRDLQTGRVVTKNLADYLVPVNADVPQIDILFPDVPDLKFNATGARGIGEIGITGVPAAIAGAIYHATGKRIRDLPITTDKLMAV